MRASMIVALLLRQGRQSWRTALPSRPDGSGEPSYVRILLAGVILFTVLGSSHAWAEDKYVGAIWNVKYKSAQTGELVDCGLFRCTTDGKVYHDGKVIGSHKTIDLDNVELEITGAKDPTRFNGTWKGTRVKKDGGVWGGVFTRKSDGKEFPMVLILKAD